MLRDGGQFARVDAGHSVLVGWARTVVLVGSVARLLRQIAESEATGRLA